jgi:hypothetical protein
MTDELEPGGQLPIEPRAATIPTRPVAGAPIVSAWGGDVHDRIYTPAGVIVSGPASIGVTAQITVQLATVAYGNAAFLDAANNRLVVPAGLSGLYAILAELNATNTVSWTRFLVRRNGATFGTGQNVQGMGNSAAYASIAGLIALADGDTIDFTGQCDAGDAADLQATRIALVRIGDRML